MVELNISDSEWLVMEAIWELGQASPAEIIEQVSRQAEWNHRTVRTLLSRLVEKGYVGRVEDAARPCYQALVKRNSCVRKEGKSFLERVFQGDATSLLLHFAKEAKLDQEKLAQLRDLLAEEESDE